MRIVESPFARYGISAVVLLTVLILISSFLDVKKLDSQVISLATAEARTNWNKDQAIRRWATRHGGIYVKPDERTPPNPYLAHLPNRDIKTSEGLTLTLMNPAYIMSQMTKEFDALYGIKGKITGQILLNPANKPDSWELKSLKLFDTGVKEVIEPAEMNGQPYLRLMRPMVMKEGCVQCHGHLGFKEGDIRGGVSISIPLTRYYDSAFESKLVMLTTHGVVWSIGILGIGFISWRGQRQDLERRRTEEELRESEKRFLDYADSASDWFWETGPDHRFTYLSERFEEVTGISVSRPIGKTREEFVEHDSKNGIWIKHLHDLTEQRPFRDFRYQIKSDDGSDQYFSISGVPFIGINDSFRGYRGTGTVLTREIESELARQNTEERFRHVFEMPLVAIGIYRVHDKSWIDFNERMCSLFGYSRAELKQMTWLDITHPDDLDKNLALFNSAISSVSKSSYSMEKRFICKDGQVVHTTIHTDIVCDAEGSPLYVVLFIEDESERKNKEEQLRQSQKMEAIGHLSSGIAHDFNNLLMAALGNIEIVEEFERNPNLRDRATTAKKAILRGADLTGRLLAFSRKQDLDPEQSDVAELVFGVKVLFERTLPESIDIVWSIPSKLWPILIDRSQLENTLLNLVLNSRDAMLAGGTLTLSCNNEKVSAVQQINKPELKAGDYVTISVKDTGTGISDSHLDQIFDPFFTTKGVGEGSGLGLSMVYGFITQSGGYVDIESDVSFGTKVTLYLPRLEAAEKSDDLVLPRHDETPRCNGETILVIEDEPDVRQITIQQLTNLGYEVIDGGDGQDIIDLCNEETCNFDLILSDVVLPNQNSGPELIGQILKFNPSAKALLMTGYAAEDVVKSETGERIYPILSKPFTKDELARKISSALHDEEQILKQIGPMLGGNI